MPRPKPSAALGAPKRRLLVAAAARAQRELISTDLARVASGPLTGVIEMSRDEFATQTMDNAKITTSRTMPLSQGFFLTNARMKSPTGSDFKYWQHRRIMDTACRTVAQAQVQFLSASVPVNGNGTIDEAEAKRLEAIVTEALKVALVDPKNVEGRPSHVSDFKYSIDRTNNVLTSETLQTKVAVRPFGYPKFIESELGFSANVSG